VNRRSVLGGLAATAVGAAAGAAWWAGRRPRPSGPSVVLILTDDQGINDLGCYYTPPPDANAYAAIETPNLDRLATDGLRLTRFYVGAAVCTPSRAALLTGCYPPRVGFGAKEGPGPGVLTPTSREGLSPDETTLAELFRAAGYRTACVGKWHLGHHAPFRPTNQGFDEFFGIPWSNNQAPLALFRGDRRLRPLAADEPLVEPFTREALEFLARCGDDPFFLYLAYSAPHEPWAVGPGFVGRSRRGRYGDAIGEVDAHVGHLLAALRASGRERDTLVVFLSDNGPWLESATAGGSAWPFRGGKADSWEGGFRSPCLVSWPGTLPGGRAVDDLCAAMDLLPTLAGICGLPRPSLPIDGVDLGATWAGAARSPRTDFAYYARGRLEAVTDGRWKRMYPVDARTPPVPAGLYDLAADPGERVDHLADAPAEAARLDAIADAYREQLGDALTGAVGIGARPIGRAS
jgi:arylsulfatase A